MHILSLPNELSGEIFLYCLATPTHREILDLTPLLLTQVCRHWRDVATCTSALWCTLNKTFRASPESNASEVQVDHLLLLWLARAKGRPISIRLAALANLRVGSVLDLLRRFPNISHLRIMGVQLGNGGALPFKTPVLCPSLDRLHLTGNALAVGSVLDCLTAPNLREFKTYLPAAALSLALRSACSSGSDKFKLKRLVIEDYAYESSKPLLHLLRAVPALTSLEIREKCWPEYPKSTPPIIEALAEPGLLPRLEELVVRCCIPPKEFPVFMDVLRARLAMGEDSRVSLKSVYLNLQQEQLSLWPAAGWERFRFTLETRREFQEMIAQGLKLCVGRQSDTHTDELWLDWRLSL
ncbi:hypothetical protein C8F01DRAFT_1105297 [Mycena amicta]|nr:hypothetical protein C8F01DRAFT_1105297 [Mycena amicta]